MKKEQLVLGLDIGANSIGWILINDNGKLDIDIIGWGSRVFEAGVNELEKGRGESRNKERQEIRSARRRMERRSRRMAKIFHLLQRHHNMLPQGHRAEVFYDLDAQIMERHGVNASMEVTERRRMAHVMPYYLRKLAVERQLPLDELGRAFYHLAHRRGFKSNRKDSSKETENGTVLPAIKALTEKMTGEKTLGAYFATLDPEKDRIRQRWTAREMFEHEFDAIIAKQREFYPDVLTDTFVKALREAFFFQRPLKSQRHLIGKCSLEPKQTRTRMYRPEFQEFRILQSVNHMRFSLGDGKPEPLTPEQRSSLISALRDKESMTVSEIKKTIGLNNKYKINFGEEQKKIMGDVTRCRMMQIFAGWDTMSGTDREQAIADVVSIQKDDALLRRAKTFWKLPDDKAKIMSETVLEEKFAAYSIIALNKLLPHLRNGLSIAEARLSEYKDFGSKRIVEFLPPVEKEISIRNPIVLRSLTQLRIVVNAIIRQYGRPDKIRIELARELRNSAEQRERIVKKNNNLEKRNMHYREEYKKIRTGEPSRDDLLRLALHEECKGVCPYTGQEIGMDILFSGMVDIEHILPLSRSLDDSFINKTLCFHDFNRHVKKNQTPWECRERFPQEAGGYDEAIERVRTFGNDEKLRRFEMNDEEFEEFRNDFSTRQLNDTRYASVAAMEYLSLLYGGTSDEEGQRIFSCAGGITAIMRNYLKLNMLLNDKAANIKSRDDHRHHAVDALAIALVNKKNVSEISIAIRDYGEHHGFERTSFKETPEDILTLCYAKLKEITTSHALQNRVRGGFHDANAWRRVKGGGTESIALDKLTPENVPSIIDPRIREAVEMKLTELGTDDPGAIFKDKKNLPVIENEKGIPEFIKKVEIEKVVAHSKVALERLTKADIASIVDSRTRRAVIEKMKSLGTDDPKKAFAKPENYPVIERPGDVPIIIRKVRVKGTANTKTIGSGASQRQMMLNSNHHAVIYEIKDKKGNPEWKSEIVSLFEAYRRKCAKQPIIQRDLGPDKKFIFSLHLGDCIELDNEETGTRQVYRIRGIATNGQFKIVRVNDARKLADTGFKQPKADFFRKQKAKKITVLPLGEIRWAND